MEKKILVDPVFSGAASPVKFTTRSFAGSDMYSTDDLPPIDYLFHHTRSFGITWIMKLL